MFEVESPNMMPSTAPVILHESLSPTTQQEVEFNTDTSSSFRDSACGDSDASIFTESIGSSMYKHRKENGRYYHSFRDGAYLKPNDEAEQERLDFFHGIWRLMLNGALYLAPICKGLQNILDVGTGTGTWAIEVADEHPSARVLGLDLSPIQPTSVPPNCSFYIDDITSEWLFNHKFDFVHARALSGSIADWPAFFQEVWRNLNDGGWVEMQDYQSEIMNDAGPTKSSRIKGWSDELIRGSQMFGKSLEVASQYAEWMKKAGFVDVHDERMNIPIGDWSEDPKLRQIGAKQLQQTLDSIEARTLALFTRVLNYPVNKTRSIIQEVQEEISDTKNRFYVTHHFVTGRKPGR